MGNQLQLQSKLEELLESENVYYQPPSSKSMSYPAIRYSINDIEKDYADDSMYSLKRSYEITVISKLPDNPVINKLLSLPYCSFNRHYITDNLNHDVFTLFY